MDLRNNVIYNWGYNSCYGGDGDVRVNLINNYYKPGPATRENLRARVANPSEGDQMKNWWIAGNFVVGSPEVTASNWLGVHPSGDISVNDIRASKPFEVAPVTTQSDSSQTARLSRQHPVMTSRFMNQERPLHPVRSSHSRRPRDKGAN